MPNRKIVLQPGCLYVEPMNRLGLAIVGGQPSVKVEFKVVRTGGDEATEHGTVLPMRFKEGDVVVLMPQSGLPTPRGFVCHQNRVAWTVEEWGGEDEMSPADSGALRLSGDATKALLAGARRPIEA